MAKATSTTKEFNVDVLVTHRAHLERQLDEAVSRVRVMALQEPRRGILVTRHDYQFFTVSLSDDIPFGLTREHQAW